MAIIISKEKVMECIRQELELTGIADKKHARPDLCHLLPELKSTIIDEVLIYTRGNQYRAARMLGLNRGTLRRRCQPSRAQPVSK